MKDGPQMGGQALPNQLSSFVQSLDLQKINAIDFNELEVQDSEMALFLDAILKRFIDKPNKLTLKCLTQLEFQNLDPKHQALFNHSYEHAYSKILEEVCEEVEPVQKPRESMVDWHSRLYSKDVEVVQSLLELEMSSARRQLVENASRKFFKTQIGYAVGDRSIHSDQVLARSRLKEKWLDKRAGMLFMEEKKQHHLRLAAKDIKKIYDNPNNQKPLWYMMQYIGYKQWAMGRGIGFKKVHLEEDIRKAYSDWVQNRIRYESIRELALHYQIPIKDEDFTLHSEQFELPENPEEIAFDRHQPLFEFVDKETKEAFFNAVYAQYYQESIKSQRTGTLELLPIDYACVAFPDEMMKAGLNFLSQGFWHTPLKSLNLSYKSPNGRADNLLFDIDSYMQPLIEHAKQGKPLPFSSITISHGYHAKNLYQRCVELATEVANHPGDYFKLELIDVLAFQDYPSSVEHVASFEAYLDSMIALASRQDRPLACDLRLKHVVDFYRMTYAELSHVGPEIDASKAKKIENLKRTLEKVDNLQRLIAINRRKLNYEILHKGEQAVGRMTEYEIEGQKPKLASKKEDIRACKRHQDLNSALQGISLEMDQEEEEEQESKKSKEKAKEKEMGKEEEQESELEQAQGTPDSNLDSAEAFVAFAKREFQGFHHKEAGLIDLWNQVMGHVFSEHTGRHNHKTLAMSCALAKEILKDPDSFRYGLHQGNMPLGFCKGKLNTHGGLVGGFYFDPHKETKVNQLTAKVHDPLEERPRKDINASQFLVKERPTNSRNPIERAKNKAVEKIFEPLTREEIGQYNQGNLTQEQDGKTVALKMLYTTSKIGPFEFQAWAMTDSIATQIINGRRHQEVAEIAANFGGQALFDLTAELHKLKDTCNHYGKKSWFAPFMENLVLQSDLDSLGERRNLGDLLVTHKQFKALQKIRTLPKDEFLWFMAFSATHAKYHAQPDLEDMLDSFAEFAQKVKQINGNKPLPTKGLQQLAAGCKDMKVGLDRALLILENAHKHDKLEVQLEVLTQLDLDGQTCAHAVELGYHVVLPQMNINKTTVLQKTISDKTNITSRLSTALNTTFKSGQLDNEMKVLFYQQFALSELPPKMDAFYGIEQSIQQIKGKQFSNHQQTQGFLYATLGFCMFHPDGDSLNENSLASFIQLVQNHDFKDEQATHDLMNSLNDLLSCQDLYLQDKSHFEPPTIASFTTTLDMIQQLKGAKHLPQAFKVKDLYENSPALFRILHLNQSREKSHSNENLAALLRQLDSHAKQNPDFAKMQGSLLNACLLCDDSELDYQNKLTQLLSQIDEQYCQDPIAKKNSEHLLKALEGINWQSINDSPPSISQLTALVQKAANTTQNNLQAWARWIKTQDGYEQAVIEVTNEQVAGQSYASVYNQEKSDILSLIPEDSLSSNQTDSLSHLIKALDESVVEVEAPQKLMVKLKQVAFEAHECAVTFQKDQHLQAFDTNDRDIIYQNYITQYPFKPDDLRSMDDLYQYTLQCQHYHQEMAGYFKACQYLANQGLSEILTIVRQVDLHGVSVEGVTELLNQCANHYEQSADKVEDRNYPHKIVKAILTTKPLSDIKDWSTINRLVKEDLLPADTVEITSMVNCMCALSVHGRLSKSSFHDLVELAQANPDLGFALCQTIEQNLNQGQTVNLALVTSSISHLLEHDIEKLAAFIRAIGDIQIMEDLAKVQDPEKCQLMMTILERTSKSSPNYTHENLRSCLEALDNFDTEELLGLATMDIDAPYPDLVDLSAGLHRLQSEPNFDIDAFSKSLQASFFEKKNDPKLLDKLFDDERVVGVINESSDLNFTDPVGLHQDEKKQLLSDYAYIHAIGKSSAVFHDKAIKDLTKAELKQWLNELKRTINHEKSTPEAKHLAMLQLIAASREIYSRATGKFPYSTQMMSLLNALQSGDMNINEIATGQGKSLTAALYATVLWAQNKPVVICTSNLTLASEGLEENSQYYDYMGISTQLIRAQSAGEEFKHDGINYSDVSNMALYLAKTDIQHSLDMKAPGLVLDEVDFTVLDEVTDYRFAMNLDDDQFGGDVNPDEWLYYQLNKFVDSDAFLNAGVDRESDIVNAIAYLKEKLIEASKPGDEAIQYAPGEGKVGEPILSHLQNRIMDFQRPGSEARKLLDTWIDSAFNANLIYKEGHGKAWVLESLYKDGKKISAARIISHHRVAKGSKWSKGVHQFVHARINVMLHDKQNRPEWAKDESIGPCPIDTEKAHVAALSSKNFVDYFTRRGGLVWGMTGTVGSSQERAELRRKYGFKLTQIATHQARSAIQLDPVFAGNAKGHVASIYHQIKKHAIDQNKMPTVIVEEDAKYAAEFKDRFLKQLKSKSSSLDEPPKLQFYNGIDYEFYVYNDDIQKYEQVDGLEVINEQTKVKEFVSFDSFKDNEAKEDFIKKQAGLYNTISITTPMMGRGTDFKPKDKKGNDHPDGLFVIGAYVEASEREQRQIIGRMGRQGKKGLYINCVNTDRFVSKLKAEGFQVPRTVQYFKPNTLSKKFTSYQKSKNMNLARERLLKQTFGDVRCEYYTKFIGMLQSIHSQEGFDEISHILAAVPGFEKDKFLKAYTQDLLRAWNRFLVKIDSQYIMLRDKYDGDFDKIFSELKTYTNDLWQQSVINAMKHNFGFDDNHALQDRAELYFSDYINYKDDQLSIFAKNEAQKKALKSAKAQNLEKIAKNEMEPPYTKVPLSVLSDAMSNLQTSEYEQAFNDIHYDGVFEQIMQGGKLDQDVDPSLSMRSDWVMPVINYALYMYQKEPNKLASSPMADKDLAGVLSIELVNLIAKANQLIEHEKRFDADIIDLGTLLNCTGQTPKITQANMLKLIEQDPKACFESLSEALMNQLHMQIELAKQHDVSPEQYQTLLINAHASLQEVLDGLIQSSPGLESLCQGYKTQLVLQIKDAKSHAYRSLTSQTRKLDPKAALERRLEQQDMGYMPYELDTLKQEIDADIHAYLSDKSKFTKRKTAAKELQIQLSFCKTPEEVMKVLSKARMKAMAVDIKKSSIFWTRNVKGSRFQDLINRSFERVILQSQDPMELLTCADTLRKEMVNQFEYLGATLIGDKHYFISNMKDLGFREDGDFADLSLHDLNQVVHDLDEKLKVLNAKRLKSTKARAALHLMQNNLEVLLDLQKKMNALSIELGSDKITISSSAKVREQSFQSNSIINHLQSIIHLRPEILADNTPDSVKRKLFSKEGGLPLPSHLLGDAARLFKLHAKSQYGAPDHMWGPPLNQLKVEALYDAFTLLDSDVTNSPGWESFWKNHEAMLLEKMKSTQAQAKIKSLQAQVLSAYRFQVLSGTHFIERNQNESDQEFKLRESRCKNYIQQVSKAYMQYDHQQGYQKLHHAYANKLQQEVDTLTDWAKQTLDKGKPIHDVVGMLGERLNRLQGSYLVEYLGQQANDIIEPLSRQHDNMESFVQLLDTHLESIAKGFLPGDKHTVQTRVIDLIQASVKEIMRSPEYEHMGDLGRVALKSHLSSKESIQRVYQMAVESRTQYFAKMLPNQIDKLLSNREDGLEWIRYLRARREVMANLAQIVLSDKHKYPDKQSRVKHFLLLQKAYIKTIKEDLKSMSKSHAQSMLDRISTKAILTVPPDMDLKQAQQLQQQLTETFVEFNQIANQRPIMAQVPELFSDKAHTGLDISVGLLQALEKTMEEASIIGDKPKDELAKNEVKEENIAQTFDEAFEHSLKATEHDVYHENEMTTVTELKELLFNEHEQFNVKRSLLELADLDERLCKIQSLFKEAIKPLDECTMQDKYDGNFQAAYAQNQNRAIVMLQNLWLDTVEAQCIKMANEQMGVEGNSFPKALSPEAKSNIYLEVLAQAKENPIINSNQAPENEKRAGDRLSALMSKINQLSEDVGALKQRTRLRS